MKRKERARDLGEALAELLAAETLSRPMEILDRARLVWPGACGAALARRTELRGVENGLLIVAAQGRHWREAAYRNRKGIRARLRASLPQLRGFRLIDAPEPARPRVTSAPRPGPDPRTADIEDPGLRAAIDGLLRATDARRQS